MSFANGVNLLTSVLAVLMVLASLQCGYVGGVVAAYFAVRIKLLTANGPSFGGRRSFTERLIVTLISSVDTRAKKRVRHKTI